MQIQAAVEEFLLDRESFGRRPNTIAFYRTNLRQVFAFLSGRGVVDVEGLDRAVVRAFFAAQYRRVEGDDLKPSTVAAYDRALRAFCRFCADEGWLECDPMRGRPKVKVPQSLPDTWELDEIAAILATCGDDPASVRDRAIILLMLDTGLRAGELVALTPDCLRMNGDRGTVIVRAEGSKSDRDRVVPFWSETLKALQRWGRVRPREASRLFVACDAHCRPLTVGPKSSALHQMFRRRIQKSGVKPKAKLCHIWRHTFAKNYVLAGGDLETLRRLLGHTSLETVRIYLGFRTEDIEQRHFELSPVRRLFEKTKPPIV